MRDSPPLPEILDVPEKKARIEPIHTLKYGDEWEKKHLEQATAVLIQPPSPHGIPLDSFRGKFYSPIMTAMFGSGIESLAKTKDVTAYTCVCGRDNLEVVKKLEFFTADVVLIESYVASAFASMDAGYRVAGYLFNQIYPMTFIGPGRAWLPGFWARGFGDLPWPEDSWLDKLQDGPKFVWSKNGKLVPESTTEHLLRLNGSESMSPTFRANKVVYQIQEGTDATKELQKQQFLNQASKLFALAEYFGYGETLLMCGFFLSSPSDAGHRFTHRDKVYVIKRKAAESAARVVARLIGWYEP